MGGFSVDCGFNGVRSRFGQSIQEGESICSWEFYGEFKHGSMELRFS